MIFLGIICVLLLIGLGFSIYGNLNLTKKYETLEEISIKNEEFIIAMRNRVLSQQSYLKQLDRKGAFESDDEVGYFFKELKKIINDISTFLEIDQIEEDKTPDIKNFITGRFK